MASCVRVLSVQTVDSSPSILLVAPNGNKTLINCGEGCQRIFLEFSQKVSTVTRICLTHLAHETIGGLPGMILTTADVFKLALQSGGNSSSGSSSNNNKQNVGIVVTAGGVADESSNGSTTKNKRTNHNPRETNSRHDDDCLPGLDLVGPIGTQQFIRSLRHFMRRDSFQLNIKEGVYRQIKDDDYGFINQNSKKRRKQNQNPTDDVRDTKDYYMVQSIVCTYSQSSTGDEATNNDGEGSTPMKRLRSETHGNKNPLQALSFLFTTPIIQGKFLTDKAIELGIPKGPLYGQLKAGKGVTFTHPTTGENVFVASSQVVEASSPSLVVAVLYYPNIDVLEQLIQSPELCKFQTNNPTQSASEDNDSPEDPVMEIIVHMAPPSIFTSEVCSSWRTLFGTAVRHMFVACETCVSLETTKPCQNEGKAEMITTNLSPFLSASAGALLRSHVGPGIYTNPVHDSVIQAATLPAGGIMLDPNSNYLTNNTLNTGYCEAVPMLEYALLPRTKRGFRHRDLFFNHWKELQDNAQSLLQSTDCLEVARQALDPLVEVDVESNSVANMNRGEIIFTGTGSAIPCKHRNVSGIYLGMANGNSMLLDVGEGTIGQLFRAKHKETPASVLQRIKAVWISHPHADHHLGLLRLLADRKSTSNECDDPLIVMAPPNLLSFLKEYELVVPAVAGSYSFLDCRDLNVSRTPSETSRELLKRLQSTLGVTAATAVPVAHCSHSYAVIFTGTSFGSVAYSGDCRPSTAFAVTGRNADVLIHEATFADGLEAEAVLKKHCTVGEALRVGQEMNAKTILLTHFSQRYPKIPLLPTPDATTGEFSGMIVIPAFDFMRITQFNIASAAKITPALQVLYPESPPENESSEAQHILAVPGLFAQKDLL
jgi:ribonuclease Z